MVVNTECILLPHNSTMMLVFYYRQSPNMYFANMLLSDERESMANKPRKHTGSMLMLAIWRRTMPSWAGQNILGNTSVLLEHCLSVTASFSKLIYLCNEDIQKQHLHMMRMDKNSKQMWQWQMIAPFIINCQAVCTDSCRE